MIRDKRTYDCAALIRPSAELPGVWLAHCLTFDVVSQGESPWDAFLMMHEAVVIAVCDDLNSEREPTAHRAPEECWERLKYVFEHGVPLAAGKWDVSSDCEIAVQFPMEFARKTAEQELARPFLTFARPAHQSSPAFAP